MAVFALLRLAKVGSPKLLALALGAVAGLVVLFWLGAPMFRQLGNLNLLVFFVGVVAATVFAGVPIAFAFGLAVFGYLALTTQTPLMVLVGRMDEGMSHLILLAVPLFVFLGLLIEMTGMARAMVAFLASMLGHVSGGLHYVLVAGMYLVSGISGSKAADMAAIAPVLFPEMKQRGAKPGDLVALLSATGAQTETIPPSLVLITIGSVTGVSIAALFTGGLLPAIVLAILLCLVVWRRNRSEQRGLVPRAAKREIGRTFLVALPALALPFLIRTALVEGVATATEVSTIGIAYSALARLLIYRRFDWAALRPMLVYTASLSGSILLIIGTATGMAWGLTQSGFSRSLAAVMTGLPGGAITFMPVSVTAFIVLGSVLEGIPAIVLFGPLLFPIARAVGIHEVHYAMVVILAMGIGLVRSSVRGRLLHGLRDRTRRSGGRYAADPGLHAGADDRNDPCSGCTLDLHRVPEMNDCALPARVRSVEDRTADPRAGPVLAFPGGKPCFRDGQGTKRPEEAPIRGRWELLHDDSLDFGLLACGVPRSRGLYARERIGSPARARYVRKPRELPHAWAGLSGANLDRAESQ